MIIPKPVSVRLGEGRFTLLPQAKVHIKPDTAEVRAIAGYLADRLAPATGFSLPTAPAGSSLAPGDFQLTASDADPSLGEEGYELSITPDYARLEAYRPAGLFHGIQTLRQLLPEDIESRQRRTAEWSIPAGSIRDTPRFVWRGAMLDVARHFFSVDNLKRYIDLLAYYKFNTLHLHLSDDQGWRIVIHGWPNLTTIGGSTQVGGGAGGYFTQEQYRDLVAYAGRRYITVVPEIDLPGHTQAALASYPQLSCSGAAPELYTGIDVGFSSLCLEQAITDQFVADVLSELAALTPGPYLHIGGDEAQATGLADYIVFIEKVQAVIGSLGKQMVGWEEIGQAKLEPNTVAQHWIVDPGKKELARLAAEQGAKIIMSPANRTYLDLKYDADTPLGSKWAGNMEVKDSYDWDPVDELSGVKESDLLGVEAPLWTETLVTMEDIEFMAFPRLLSTAEVGWSARVGRDWKEYRERLAAHGPRLEALQVNFYRSPQVPWQVKR